MDVNEKFTPMLGGFHFFSRTIDFNSLCLYVIIKLMFDFFLEIVLEKMDPIFHIFKYIIIWFSRYSILIHLRIVNFQNQLSKIWFSKKII
jgi:hypothetical protein